VLLHICRALERLDATVWLPRPTKAINDQNMKSAGVQQAFDGQSLTPQRCLANPRTTKSGFQRVGSVSGRILNDKGIIFHDFGLRAFWFVDSYHVDWL